MNLLHCGDPVGSIAKTPRYSTAGKDGIPLVIHMEHPCLRLAKFVSKVIQHLTGRAKLPLSR